MSATFTEPAKMFEQDEYRAGIPPLELESNRCWNAAVGLGQNAERAEQEAVTIKRHALVLYASRGWELKPLTDLTRPRAFMNRRPGARPGRSERGELDGMTPSQFLRSFFEEGIAWTAAPDDFVWTALLAYAEAHYSTSNTRAARRMNEAVIRGLAVRAGIEIVSGEELLG